MISHEVVQITGKVIIILSDPATGKKLSGFEISNIITNAGDLFYAQRANQEVPSNLFHAGGLILGIAGNVPSKTSLYSDITSIVPNSFKNLEPGYPKRNDQDPSNTGANVDSITYKFKYLSNEANSANINRLAITVQNPMGASQLLMYTVLGAPIIKNNGIVLTVFINHNFNGI